MGGNVVGQFVYESVQQCFDAGKVDRGRLRIAVAFVVAVVIVVPEDRCIPVFVTVVERVFDSVREFIRSGDAQDANSNYFVIEIASAITNHFDITVFFYLRLMVSPPSK
jgi:hypothetical protein